jgi:hypothetical protein
LSRIKAISKNMKDKSSRQWCSICGELKTLRLQALFRMEKISLG